MRSRTRAIDAGLALAILLSLVAAWPFLVRPSLPRETDAELHVFRAAELGYSLRAGDLYPRWAPDFYYGYGYPIFNYYAPLTYYLANLLSLGLPGGAVFGVKAVFVLGFLCAGCGAYLLGHELTGRRAGLVAASCYLFAPYVFTIDPHLRGDLAEFFALSLMPVSLWALAAHRRASSRRTLLLASLLTAASILTHNLLGLVTFALLGAYIVWSALFAPSAARPRPFRALLRAALPLALGVGLAAFFWLPVALEGDEVRLSNLVGPGHFDYRNHFLAWGELLAPSLPIDLGSVNPAFRFNLGVVTWPLALLGVVAIATARTGHYLDKPPISDGALLTPDARHRLFWPISGLALLALTTRASLPVWDAIPLMAFFQFPWRLLGPATLCLAITGGFAVDWLRLVPSRLSSAAVATLVGLPLAAALPIFIPPSWGPFGPTDQLAMLDFELNGLALGTTSTGDFVPVTVDVVPGPAPSLVTSYRAGGPIDRVNRETLPPGADVHLVAQRPTLDVFRVSSDDDFALRLYRFMFPGWRASIDGRSVSIEVAQPEGFVTVHVPPGEHSVRVWLGSTPSRTAASLISAACLGILALLAIRSPATATEPTLPAWGHDERAIVLAVVAVTAVATVGSMLRLIQPSSTGTVAVPAQVDVHQYLQGGIDLIGFDLDTGPVQPGEAVELTLYWKAREPVPANYQVFVHLTTVAEHIWSQSDKLNPGDYPTTRWPLDRYVRDSHTLTIPLGTPPGEYVVRVGLWDRTTGSRQLVLERDGAILGDSIALSPRVVVAPADRQPDIAQLPLDIMLRQEVAESVELLGVDLEPTDVFDLEQGRLSIVLYWRVLDRDIPAYQVSLRMLDAQGGTVTRAVPTPTDGLFPTQRWQSGQVIRDVHSLWIDTTVPAGEYRLEVGLIPPSRDEPTRWWPLASLARTLP